VTEGLVWKQMIVRWWSSRKLYSTLETPCFHLLPATDEGDLCWLPDCQQATTGYGWIYIATTSHVNRALLQLNILFLVKLLYMQVFSIYFYNLTNLSSYHLYIYN
jgi:hypothetical protein